MSRADDVPRRLLVVDDEPINRRLLAALFTAEGFAVELAEDGEAALAMAEAWEPALVLLDLRLPGLGGMEVLARLKARSPSLPVIVVTSHGDVASAVEATRLGAYDFLLRPIHNDKLVLAVRRALERRIIEHELHALRREARAGEAMLRLRGLGPAMQAVVERVRAVADSPLTVLLQGETGTGKEVVARALHQESGRRERPFVAVDCGAIPESLLESELFGYEKGAFSGATRRKEGLLEVADRGTLFLDEVANFAPGTQAKLLRVIQERTLLRLGGSRRVAVDVRLIAATNQPLEAEVQRGLFRQDLYFRLAEFVISLPPLRERREDVITLARRFLEEASLELRRPASTLSPEALDLLAAHAWPGNVRELRNVIRQAAISSTGVTIGAGELRHLLPRQAGPSARQAPAPLGGSLREIVRAAADAAERQAIVEALRLARGNKAEAARLLRTDYKTLYVKLKRHHLEPGR